MILGIAPRAVLEIIGRRSDRVFDDCDVNDLGYVTGTYHYDDEQEDSPRLQTRKHVKRALAHMLKFALNGISDPIDSYTNPDY